MDHLHKYINSRLRTNHFIKHMGIELVSISKGEAALKIHIENYHLQQNGFTHGGVTATLCDVATGIAAYTMAPEGKNVVTADLKISYLHPSTANMIVAKGRVRKAGNLMFFCDADVFDITEEGERLVATATAIMVAVDIPLAAS
ncbi:MAG: PaaI family thioesterase [Bacteroidetes bacterium]|nr:PaaI family thioesterase [Bacteroidota bacterium]